MKGSAGSGLPGGSGDGWWWWSINSLWLLMDIVPEVALDGRGSRVGDDDLGTVIPGALCASPGVVL